MNEKGWVKLYRKSLNSSVWYNPMVWMVWCWCLMKASHDPHKFPFNGQDLDIKEGQFVTGIEKAVKEIPTNTQQKHRTALTYLKSTNRITIKTTNKFSIITIVNWEKYQTKDLITSKITSKLTNEQQTNNKPVTTYKNVKNEKNILLESFSNEKGVLKVKKKKMKKYNENNPDDDELVIDADTGELAEKKTEVKTPKPNKPMKFAMEYVKYRKFTYKTEKDYWDAVFRYMKPASSLLRGHSGPEILDCMKWCQEKYPEWSLETVQKKIDEYKTYTK